MDGLFTLLSLSLVMATVSFVVGSFPLSFSLSPSQLRFVSALGMGVLVGTSLIVIIPEGVETLYSSSLISHQHGRRTPTAPSPDVSYLHSIPSLIGRGNEHLDSIPGTSPDATDSNPPTSHTKDGDVHILNEPKAGEDSSTTPGEPRQPSERRESTSPHAWIGVALISGFILMYLVDKLPQFATFSSHQQQRPYHISLDNLGSGLSREISPSRNGSYLGANGSLRQSHSFATTTGLVIHAAADGIALGASTSNTSLSFVIFVAIMVHKAPAAFGLTSVLLRQGLSSRAARGHLLIFSLAAPAGALLTWLIAHSLTAGHVGDEQKTHWRTGMLLLFSAGTFLYVAMHTMQENSPEASRRDSHINGYVDGRESPQRTKKSLRDLVASVIGMTLPLLLQIGHAH